MKLVYTPSADRLKTGIIKKYPGLDKYFSLLEGKIRRAPQEAFVEKIVTEEQTVTVYKRNVKTGLFSGNISISYLYLSLFYIIDPVKKRIVVMGAYIKHFT